MTVVTPVSPARPVMYSFCRATDALSEVNVITLGPLDAKASRSDDTGGVRGILLLVDDTEEVERGPKFELRLLVFGLLVLLGPLAALAPAEAEFDVLEFENLIG